MSGVVIGSVVGIAMLAALVVFVAVPGIKKYLEGKGGGGKAEPFGQGRNLPCENMTEPI